MGKTAVDMRQVDVRYSFNQFRVANEHKFISTYEKFETVSVLRQK